MKRNSQKCKNKCFLKFSLIPLIFSLYVFAYIFLSKSYVLIVFDFYICDQIFRIYVGSFTFVGIFTFDSLTVVNVDVNHNSLFLIAKGIDTML